MVAVETDRRLLNRERLALATPYVGPANELEWLIAQQFSEVLRIDRVGVDDAFFDLGGDSLSAEALCISIERATGRELRISSLVFHDSPRKLAHFIATGNARRLLALRPADDRPPIFHVHGGGGVTFLKPTFLKGLAPDQHMHLFELPGIHGDVSAYDSVEEIAASYVAQICEVYPQGPVFLSAFCRSAFIALEMSAQLAARGREVEQLVLFEPSMSPGTVRYYCRLLGYKNAHARRPLLRSLEEQFRRLWHLLLLGRWTDGTLDQDFDDHRLRFSRELRQRFRYWRVSRSAKTRHRSGLLVSAKARAKLAAALRHYRPRRFEGAVTALVSLPHARYFVDANNAEARIWGHLLPQLRVQVVGETHQDVQGASSSQPAMIMQSIFDAAASALRKRSDQGESVIGLSRIGGR